MAKPKYIESPYNMWELFTKYVEWCKDNPVTSEDYVGGAGKKVTRSYDRPLTMSGFRAFGHREGVTIHHYFSNSEGAYDEYRSICRAIEDEIRDYQITGGLVGLLNSSITQRLNGLTERVDQTSGGEKVNNITVEIVRPNEDTSDSSI